MSLNPLTYQPHSNIKQGAAIFTASSVQLLVCDRSVLVNVTTHTFVGLKCLTETKIQILYDHVDHTRFHIVEMGCQMVQLLSAHTVGPTMFVNLTPAKWFNFYQPTFLDQQCSSIRPQPWIRFCPVLPDEIAIFLYWNTKFRIFQFF